MGVLRLNGKEYGGGSGGSGSEDVELTIAEYLALPDTKLSDDKNYFITDINNDNVLGYPPLIYSDDEREIGVWRDGKPLYQKTINVPAVNSQGIQTYSISELNIGTCVDLQGYSIRNANGNRIIYYHPTVESSDYMFWARFDAYTGNLRYKSYFNGTNESCDGIYITLQYTKTTDTPGAGIWNGQGCYSHHYSTNETVIGTWINGKPLYEKTINFGAIPSSTTKEVDHNISNLGMVIDFEGMMINADGVTYETLPSGENSNFRVQILTTKIRIITGASWVAWTNSYITLKYTKITD